MSRRRNTEKGVVLLIVLATLLVVVILSSVILNAITNQSRLTNHQISRIKAYYADRGMMTYALEMLRKGEGAGGWAADPTNNRYVCHSKVVGGDCSSLGISPPYYATITTDAFIPYDILITIFPLNQALGNTVTRLDIKTDYTYTPE